MRATQGIPFLKCVYEVSGLRSLEGVSSKAEARTPRRHPSTDAHLTGAELEPMQ